MRGGKTSDKNLIPEFKEMEVEDLYINEAPNNVNGQYILLIKSLTFLSEVFLLHSSDHELQDKSLKRAKPLCIL